MPFGATVARQVVTGSLGYAAAMEAKASAIVDATIAHIGKPRRAAEMEVKRSIAFVRACTEHLHGASGDVLSLDAVPAGRNLVGFTRRIPYGAVAAVTPFTHHPIF